MTQVWQFKLPGSESSMAGLALYTLFRSDNFNYFGCNSPPKKMAKAILGSLVAILVVFTIVALTGIDTKKVIDIALVGSSLISFPYPTDTI